MPLASTMTRAIALRVIPSILWVARTASWHWTLPTSIAFFRDWWQQISNLGITRLGGTSRPCSGVARHHSSLVSRHPVRLMPPHMLVLSTFPFVPIAVLGILLHPPFHTGMGVLIEISDIIHHMRGGGVLLGTIVALILYLHAVIGAVCFRYRRGGCSFQTALGEAARYLLPSLVLGALLVVGLTQAMTYISIAFDDQVRYWSVADALARGQGYPLRTFDQEFANSQGEAPVLDR